MPDVLFAGAKNSLRDSALKGAVDVVIPSDLVEARRVQEDIEQLLKKHHFGEREVFGIRLALEEALVNAVKHGNQMDRGKRILVSYKVHGERFEVLIIDEGKGFNPADVPDPIAFENLERPCGRGLLLMRHYMTDVVFHAPGNRVFMCKVRSSADCNGHS